MVKTLESPNAIATGTPIIKNKNNKPNRKSIVIMRFSCVQGVPETNE